MKYARPPFPVQLYARFCKLAIQLGYTVRGQKWIFLEKLLDFADLDQHTREMFRNHSRKR